MANISIRVTQADIDKAIVKNSSHCVVATAIARSIPDANRIVVDVQAIRFSTRTKAQRHTYLTPPVVAGYVVAFDAGDPIHPFRFTLRSDQHMLTRTDKGPATTAGKETDRTRQAVSRAQRSVKRAEAKVSQLRTQKAPAVQISRAETAVTAKRAVVAEREEARESVLAAYEGQRRSEPKDKSLPPPIPKVFKRKERSYGIRLLRINQQQQPNAVAAPAPARRARKVVKSST
jgi:hypothetical protein